MKGTVRLWDKEFNLLATWPSDAKIYFTFDREDGERVSGPLTVEVK